MKNLYRTALPLIAAAAVLITALCVGGLGAAAAVTDTFVDEIVDGFNYDPVNGPVVDFSSEGSPEMGAPGHRMAFEQNADLERTLLLKQDNDRNPNHTEYIVYKMAKNICGFELDAVVCAGLGDILEDLSVFISKTGEEGTWEDVKIQATIYEYDPDIYLKWDMAYWFNTTVTNAQKIPVGYPYLKIQFNACNDPQDVPWNVAIDTVKIRMGTNDPVPEISADKLLTQTWEEINASRDAGRTTTNDYPTNSTTASTTTPTTTPTDPAPTDPAFAMDSVTALAGQTVTVPLRIVNNPGIIGMRAIVTYDPVVLTPTAMEAQDFVGATFGPLSNPLSVIWYDAINPDNTTDGVVALCTFTVAADAPAGEYPLLVSIADPDDNYNAAWETVEFATIHGSVRVVDYVAGDANSDGKVNVRDLGCIQQYLNGWAVEAHLEASDVTGDGKVNVRDLGRLQQHLNGWDVTLEHGSGNTTSTTIPTAGPTTKPTTAPTQTQLQLVTDQDKILADAFRLGPNETTPYIAQLTGKVTSIDSEYNPQYDSISVIINIGGKNILCYKMTGDGCDRVKPGDTITVTGVIKNFYYEGATKGNVEFTWDEASGTEVTLVQLVEAPTVDLSTTAKILAAAQQLQDGESLSQEVTLTGKVLDIENPFSPEYQNITVNMVVENITIKCYRLKGNGVDKIKPGDTITVKGWIKNYMGIIEFDLGCEMTKRVAGTTTGPETDQTKILADAFALAPGAMLAYQAQLTGTITEITTAYSDIYKNITVIIEVGGKKLKCYRMKGTGADSLKIGDGITVTGTIKNYLHSSGVCEIEFDQGCTFVKN